MVLYDLQAPPESGQMYDSPFLEHPWRTGGMVNSPRTSNSAPGCSLCLGGEMARCVIIYPFMAVANELVGYQGLGRHMIRKLVTKKFGEDVCK